MRINKYLASCGVASRRACESLITDGRVKVNGELAQLTHVVNPCVDVVTLDDKPVHTENERIILLFNKPRGVVSTSSDPQGRRTVASFFSEFNQRLFSIGRLDLNSEGLLIMTNDGDLAQAMSHPSHNVDKTYYVECAGSISPDQKEQLERGVPLDDGMTAPARVQIIKSSREHSSLLITIHEGRNRQVRRMMEYIGRKTQRLRRQRIGELSLEGIAPGTWRNANANEIRYLDSLTDN